MPRRGDEQTITRGAGCACIEICGEVGGDMACMALDVDRQSAASGPGIGELPPPAMGPPPPGAAPAASRAAAASETALPVSPGKAGQLPTSGSPASLEVPPPESERCRGSREGGELGEVGAGKDLRPGGKALSSGAEAACGWCCSCMRAAA